LKKSSQEKTRRGQEDLTGRRFGMLTVTGPQESRDGRRYWMCLCDCGHERVVSGSALRSGRAWSCGCTRKTTMVDLTDRKFGRLRALEPTARRDKKGSVYWRCRCDCGRECEVPQDRLAYGNTTSCGCKRNRGRDPDGTASRKAEEDIPQDVNQLL